MNYYKEIKKELLNNEINRNVKKYSINKSDLTTYYNVGKKLIEAGNHYGESIIKEYANRLTNELNIKYSVRTLYKMIKYSKYIDNEKMPTVSAKSSWSHYDELLKLKDEYKIKFYIKLSEEQNLSVRELRKKIKNQEYERLDEETKIKLIKKEENNVIDFVKNLILIKNSNNYEYISEKILQKIILEDITNFMNELGEFFCFVGNEYKIKIGDRYNYIDLLLYNIKYKCYVVIELKVVEINSNHTGQIQKYMNYIDQNVKGYDDNKTVGIIICKKNNQYVINYCSDSRIISREYKII